ncbi:hypothetical protein A3197_16055 [Candidatus Thiodiazotropha endoloripes]|nr:hypothetical protein A3197_16055 [Candidatus Thiodiazotropha endoloripes]
MGLDIAPLLLVAALSATDRDRLPGDFHMYIDVIQKRARDVVAMTTDLFGGTVATVAAVSRKATGAP